MNEPVNIIFPHNIRLAVKREDKLHPHISGNKFRKLKYNLAQAQKEKLGTVLTFGGAFSNHIAATAAAGKEYGFKSIGIIRGEELKHRIESNPTLDFAAKCGMELHFVSREQYRAKNDADFLSRLNEEYGRFYMLPEGGTNMLAVQGCTEILDEGDNEYTHIAVAVGTGGTIAGIINSASAHQSVIGFPALKGAGISDDIAKFALGDKWSLVDSYHFGGYAKVSPELIDFMNDFFTKTGILLDPVYTGKLFFGVIDMIYKNIFPENSKILLIHTGGLQGIAGMNRQLARKEQTLINT